MSDTTVDIETIRRAYHADPSELTLLRAREFRVPEVQVLRAMPADRVTELDISKWEEIIRSFEGLGEFHVVGTNQAATVEAIGEFAKFSKVGPFFNVQHTIDMHIRYTHLGSVFAVNKPSHMDKKTTLSVQFFDLDGNSAFKAFLWFGVKEPSAEKLAQFNSIRDRFALKQA